MALRYKFTRLCTSILIILGSSAQLQAAEDDIYPVRPIVLMIPASAGGGADVSFRLLAQAMEPILGQKIEIVNKPEDSGARGLAELAKAPPDGYSLGGAWNGPLTASTQIRKVDYSLDSFTPIASTFDADYVLCARKDFPAQTGAEIVQLAGRKPLGYSYGNEGKGGSGYFAAELLFEDLGILLRGQGFDGSADEAKNFAAGKVDFYFGTTTAILPLIKSAEAKCLITVSGKRADLLPAASTVKELGVPDRGLSLWRLVIAPKGTPRDRVTKLEAAIRNAMSTPAVQAFLIEKNERAVVTNSDVTMKRLRQEFAAFSEAANRLGLKPE